jgi:hypothetical protein
LHSKEIVHGTLSPDEVIIKFKSDCEIVAKIAKLTPGNYYLNLMLRENRNSNTKFPGQDDWGLPTASEEDDVRRLGCIGYCLLSPGRSHPFGTSELRQGNIEQKKYELKNLSPESYNLIWSMVDQPVPCNAVLFHPFFWSCEERVDFFKTAHSFISDTSPSKVESFPISPTGGELDSDLGKWFQRHSGIPQNSQSALETFILRVSVLLFFKVTWQAISF